MNLRWLSVPVTLVLLGGLTLPKPVHAADADADIRDVLATQVAAWNKGDLAAFMQGYAESCTFMGKQVVHGRDKVLTRYRKAYPNSAAMGQLTFANLDVRELDEKVAIATGTFHLVRTAAGGGDAGGYFSLVFKNFDDEWQIVLDHTSADTSATGGAKTPAQ